MTLLGFDTLSYPDVDSGPAVNFAAAQDLLGFSFVVIRAGRSRLAYNDGGAPIIDHVDNIAYQGYVTQLKAARIPWIAVYAAYPWEWANEQAFHFYSIIQDDLPTMPFVSLERIGEWLPRMESNRIDFYNAFTGRMNALTAGRYKPDPQIGLYTNLSWLNKYLMPLPDEFRKNVYNYTAQWHSGEYPQVIGFDKWVLWQCDAGQTLFNGTAADFNAWPGFDVVDPPEPEPEPEPEPVKSFWARLLELIIELLQKLLKG